MSHFRRKAARGPLSPAAGGWAETQVEPSSPQAGWAETRVDEAPGDAGWSETRVETALATRFIDDAEDYLAASPQDIGRLTGADVRELFVSCDAAEALQQQFDHLQPEFIAVHDIGTASSGKLLAAIASASGRTVQKLVIRRQGFGNALATLEFIDTPSTEGKPVRLYSTEAGAEPVSASAIARTLMGFSRLAVVMVGDLPAAAMAAAMQPLREAMPTAGWRNRQLLLLPLGAAATLASHGISLGQLSGVAVRTTPQVLRPADAWAFVAASWSRFGDPLPTPGARPPHAPPAAASPPVVQRPMPLVGAAPSANPDATADQLDRYLHRLGDIAGMVGCCVFDVSTGRCVAHAGAGPEGSELALHGAQLLSAMGSASRLLGLGRMTPDAALTLGAHHLLLRGVPHHPGLAVHALLDKNVANLTLARLQLQRMDALFERPPG